MDQLPSATEIAAQLPTVVITPFHGNSAKTAADLAHGKRVSAFTGIERMARLKLDRLEAAMTLQDLAALPGNRFEALKGNRKEPYSIRINDQWRVCFQWPKGSPGPVNVEIVYYH